MEKGYAAVIFDLDGTLLDTSAGILAATRQTLLHYGHAVPDDEVLRSFIGPAVKEGFARYLSLDEQESVAYASTYRAYYTGMMAAGSVPYCGVASLLCTLRADGLRLAVATYKDEEQAVQLLKKLGLARYFDVIHGADAAGARQKADIIRLCLDELDISHAARAVMVGDSVHDARAAFALDMDFIGVTYGFGFRTAREAMEAGALAGANEPAEIAASLWHTPV